MNGENPQAGLPLNGPNSITLNFDAQTVRIETDSKETHLSFSDPEAFAVLSEAWLLLGWHTKFVYTFSWLGRPIIQLPEDLLRLQEAIYQLQPDVIVETGVAHGGSLVFHATLCRAIGRGRVIGVDIEIRSHNRQAIENHDLSDLITLVEGNSIAASTFLKVRSLVKEGETAMVILDSNHSKDHVLAELKLYADLVSPGSYLIAADGIMEKVSGAPRTQPDWTWNNPKAAVKEFLGERDDFTLITPQPIFDEGTTIGTPTYWPDGWLRRKSSGDQPQ